MTIPDPYATLGIEPSLDLDADALEARYLALSRESHPDHHGAADPSEGAEVLLRSAAINDAYRTLRDRWSRARALLDRIDPGAFDAHKRLDPAFLADAMEVAESVAEAVAERGADPAGPAPLEARLRADVERDFAALRDAFAAGDAARAATLLHQSMYHRKALADLTGARRGHAGGPR